MLGFYVQGTYTPQDHAHAGRTPDNQPDGTALGKIRKKFNKLKRMTATSYAKR